MIFRIRANEDIVTLTESYLEKMLNACYGLGWKTVTVIGSPKELRSARHWGRSRAVKSKKHPGFFYWHNISELGIDYRLVFIEGMGDVIELREGHLELRGEYNEA